MEKISVIVPYYNSNIFLLRKCILSLLSQTYKNLEILVVVDGSPKNLGNLKKHFTNIDNRIKFLDIKHSGVSTARNLGIKNTDGKYIVFVDSDDYVDEIFVEKLYKGITTSDLSICGVAEQFYPTADAYIDTKIFFSLPAEYNYLQYTNFSVNKLYKREIIEKYNISFPEKVKLGEDALFLANYYEHISQIAICSLPLYHYVPNPTSATRKFQPKYWEWEKQVIYKQWNLFHKYPLTEREGSFCYAWLYHKFKGIFRYYYESGNKEAIKIVYEIEKDELFTKLINCENTISEFWTRDMIKDLQFWKKGKIYFR